MSSTDLCIRGQRVVTAEGTRPASIRIRDGRILAVGPLEDVPRECAVVVEARDDSIVMPGLVDTHVHINEPGRTHWEGFETATRAAAAGGVTTLVEMPLNSIPPTTTLEGLESKLEAARSRCHVDVGFWGGVVPGNFAELRPLYDAGVAGFKCFLVHSGVDEFPNVTEAELRRALPELKSLGAVLIVHAELPGPIEEALERAARMDGNDPRRYETFLSSRPRAAENEAVALIIRLSREYGTRLHIVHHSSSDALAPLREARAAGMPLTVETCPHYLCFAAGDVPTGATEFKCCPPIRERENNERLWDALSEGLIDMVVSDHSPCPPEMKRRDTGDFMEAWGGISSLQLRLPVMWTMARERGFSIERLIEWMARAPARLVRLAHRKGAIIVGHDADIVIFNTDATFRVEPSVIEHRHKLTPYNGLTLRGVVETTYLRGEKIYDRGRFAPEPAGALLVRGDYD
ncbi:MAG TPA: allantoinase AllB [Pyrinomonadaceae bacterium]|jgi:allantoinase|nr:allantoinase AllB [Pyrinomonadaceae bacterium]